MIRQLHCISWAQGQISGQADHQDTHQRVLQQRHLGAETKEETEERERKISLGREGNMLQKCHTFKKMDGDLLSVTLRRPVVPLVICLRLLCEKHFVKAAGTREMRDDDKLRLM